MEIIAKNYSEYPDLYLPTQFDKSENLKKFLDTYLSQFKNLHEALVDLSNTTDVLTAEGYQLDLIGEIIGLSRQGLDDVSYRQEILTKIVLNNSNGYLDDILSYLKLVSKTDLTFGWEYYPARTVYSITTTEADLADITSVLGVTAFFAKINSIIKRTLALGVNNGGIIHDIENETFGFCELWDAGSFEDSVCAGDLLMQAGEDYAESHKSEFVTVTATDDFYCVLPDESETGIVSAGDDLAQSGEDYIVATRIAVLQDLGEYNAVLPEFYER
jgi:hypothetical protein